MTMATMTPGDCGSAEHDAEAIAAIRRGEAQAAAELIGADYLCLEFRDLAIFNDDESRRRVTEVLRRVRPDVVLTAPPVDYLCDHEMTSLLVRDACFAAPDPQLRHPAVGARPAARPRSPTSISSTRSRGSTATVGPCRPGFIVDVSRVFDIKRQMLACHASQRNWLLRQHGIDEYLESQAQWGAPARGRDRRGPCRGVPPVPRAPLSRRTTCCWRCWADGDTAGADADAPHRPHGVV